MSWSGGGSEVDGYEGLRRVTDFFLFFSSSLSFNS